MLYSENTDFQERFYSLIVPQVQRHFRSFPRIAAHATSSSCVHGPGAALYTIILYSFIGTKEYKYVGCNLPQFCKAHKRPHISEPSKRCGVSQCVVPTQRRQHSGGGAGEQSRERGAPTRTLVPSFSSINSNSVVLSQSLSRVTSDGRLHAPSIHDMTYPHALTPAHAQPRSHSSRTRSWSVSSQQGMAAGLVKPGTGVELPRSRYARNSSAGPPLAEAPQQNTGQAPPHDEPGRTRCEEDISRCEGSSCWVDSGRSRSVGLAQEISNCCTREVRKPRGSCTMHRVQATR